jgi:hypothetical protein
MVASRIAPLCLRFEVGVESIDDEFRRVPERVHRRVALLGNLSFFDSPNCDRNSVAKMFAGASQSGLCGRFDAGFWASHYKLWLIAACRQMPIKIQMKKVCRVAPKAAMGESGCSLKALCRCASVS